MSELAEKFIRHLQALKERDSGAMARLRHSLAFDPGAYPPAFPYVERFVGNGKHEYDSWRLALYVVAGLYAKHSHHQHGQSFATAFGELMRRRDSASIENRFVALLSADAENVHNYLRQAISLLAAENLALDYAVLLDDLSCWLNPHAVDARDRLRQRWARDFYHAIQHDAAPESQTTTETITN